MALREINIPFGPDKTGGLGFGILADNNDPDGVKDPFAPSTPDPYANDAVATDAPDAWTSWQGIPSAPQRGAGVRTVAPDTRATYDTLNDETVAFSELLVPDEEEVVVSRIDTASATAPVERVMSAEDVEEDDFADTFADESEHDDVSMSFAALKSSLGQSRELKARERDIEDFRTQLEAERQELEDREYILNNYDLLVSEQNYVIDECTRQRESDKEELSQVVTQLEQVTTELENAKAYYDEQMQPLQTEIGRANAEADQAKNDERSRKSELNAAESEVRRAANPNDAAMAQAKYDHIKQAYDQACAISADAQDHLSELQRIHEDALHQIEQTEGPLRHAIEDLQHDEEELKEIIAQLGEDISVARKRLQYCEGVYLFPEETEKLRNSVALDEEELREMEEDLDFLREQLELNKSKARKAKFALVAGVVAVVVVVVALCYIFLR